MLAAVSEKLTEEGLSIEDVTTQLQRGKSGRNDFVVEADCVTTKHMDKDRLLELTSSLGSLKQALDLDVVDVRVQRFATQPARRTTTRP